MSGSGQAHHTDVLRYIGELLQTQWRRHGKRLKDCQRHFSKGAVHDSRVATRKLLATIELLDTFLPESELRKAREKLKEYFDIFGPLRDTQVQLTHVTQLTKHHPAAVKFCHWLHKREKRLTRKTHKAVLGIKTHRLHKRITALITEIQECRRQTSHRHAFDLVLHSLALAHVRVLRLQLKVDSADTTTIHRTRIAFKHYRYMVEALRPLLPMVTEQHRETMREFQTLAGNIQDAGVLADTFEKFVKRKKFAPATATRLRKTLQYREQALIRKYLKAADSLLEACPGPDLPAPAPR